MGEIGVGIIGTGFMGRAHALAYRAAAVTFPELRRPVLIAVADVDAGAAEAAAAQFGFRRWTADWRSLVDDPSIAIVSITTPTLLHREMALAAIAAGKHVHCEKPIAPDAAAGAEMTATANAAGIVTQLGFNYLKNPLLAYARELIETGEIGEVTNFRGIHAEDFMADADVPHSWRTDRAGGGGAIADIGSHIIAMARYLVGPIVSVNAGFDTVVGSRPTTQGGHERRPVEVDDIARLTVRFARGCGGSIEASWVASGRNMQLAFEISGSKGAIAFTQERLNELLLYRAGERRSSGFIRIETGPQHPPYGRFCVAPGHQLGFNDLKTIEMADFLAAIDGGPRRGPDFGEGLEVQRVVDAALASGRSGSWEAIAQPREKH